MSGAQPFTAMVVTSELGVLRRLHGMLEFDPIDSRERFGDLMKAAFNHCDLDARALSDDLGYSFSAVYRWIEGRTAPHQSLWPTIVAWIMRALEARITAAEQQESLCA
jgi:predicted DNA-binding transcriptional regulator AlpA